MGPLLRCALIAILATFVGAGCAADDEVLLDAPLDGPPRDCDCVDTLPDSHDPCGACGPGTLCVQLLGGDCTSITVTCEPIVPGCDQPACSAECDQAYCDPGGISTCFAASCPLELPDVFHCYGV